MSVPQIEKAQKGDLSELFKLEQLCFGAEAFSRRQLRYLLTQANGDFLLTRSAGEISAFMILLKKKNSFGMRLYSIAVSPGFRGKGLGQLLLEEALRLAANAGCQYLTLEVSEGNDAAVSLYLRQGFEVFGERLSYYKDGSKALLMRKSVKKE